MADWYDAARVSQKGSVVLSSIAPKLAAQNAARRVAAGYAPKQQTRRFSAAKFDRLTSGWMATTASINQDLRTDLNRLRARSRDLARNNDYGRKFAKMVAANIVGPAGFKLQARSMNTATQPDQMANDAIESGFYAWAARGVCEITGRMSFADLCRALAMAAAVDGEFLVRKIRGKSARNRFGYALQQIDVDRLDTELNLAGTATQNAIVMGIEVDGYRRPVAYHIFTSHPNDGSNGGRSRERIPADDILHGFIVEHAEQVRGVPWTAAAILTLHHLGEFEQSALIAARKGADTLGFFVSPDGEAPSFSETGVDDEPITVSVPGQYDTLPQGYDFRSYDSKYPDAMLADFCKNFVRRAATGLNVAYNGLANDLEGVNFSSIRAGVLEERDQWMALQGWFIDALLEPVYADFVDLALLNGALVLPNGSQLPASKRDKFVAHQWQGRRWAWVDPVKDVDASITAIKAGLQSPYTIANQMGLDLEEVIADLARANAAAEAAGIPTYSSAASPAPQQVPDATGESQL